MFLYSDGIIGTPFDSGKNVNLFWVHEEICVGDRRAVIGYYYARYSMDNAYPCNDSSRRNILTWV